MSRATQRLAERLATDEEMLARRLGVDPHTARSLLRTVRSRHPSMHFTPLFGLLICTLFLLLLGAGLGGVGAMAAGPLGAVIGMLAAVVGAGIFGESAARHS